MIEVILNSPILWAVYVSGVAVIGMTMMPFLYDNDGYWTWAHLVCFVATILWPLMIIIEIFWVLGKKIRRKKNENVSC